MSTSVYDVMSESFSSSDMSVLYDALARHANRFDDDIPSVRRLVGIIFDREVSAAHSVEVERLRKSCEAIEKKGEK